MVLGCFGDPPNWTSHMDMDQWSSWIIQMPQVKFLWTERSWNVDVPIPAWMRKPRRSGRCFVVADGAFSVVWHVWHDVHISDDLMDYIWLYEYYAVNLSPIPKMGRWWQRYPSLCKVVAVITVLLAWLKVGALCFQESSCHFFLRTFQEPKLRYLPYVGSMSGDMPQEYGFI